jgi:hypothetical protein
MLRRRFGRFEQIELGFPIAQDIRLDADNLADLADLKVDFFRQAGSHCRVFYYDDVDVGEAKDEVDDMPFRFFFMI